MAALSAPVHRRVLLRNVAITPWLGVLVATGVVGIVLRVWVYRSVVGTTDGDEGVFGLVGRHILDGQFPAFGWGLNYGGIQELLLTAPIFWLFGSSWIALRIVPMIIWGVTSIVIWRVGRRTIGEPAARAAGALFFVWPPYLFYELEHQHGYYASDVFYCTLLMLLALRVVEEASTPRAAVFGLVVGLAWWETSHVAPVLLVVVAWTIWRRPDALRKLWIALPLAIVGALPWIVWNLKHDWGSFDVVGYDAHSTYAHRLRVFVSPLLPMIVGVRMYWTQKLVLPHLLTDLVLLILAAVFAFGLFRAIRAPRSDRFLIYTVAILFPFVYAISAYTIESGDPRYLVVYTPVLVLLLAQLATTWLRGSVLIALGALMSFVVMHNAIANYGTQIDPPRNFRPLIATLDGLGVHYVYSSHWVAYKLAFETNERIIAVKSNWESVSWDGRQAQVRWPVFVRYPPWERSVRAHHHAFVFYRDQVPPIAAQLRRFGYRTRNVGTLVVYWLPVK